jgi:hypothetical protein
MNNADKIARCKELQQWINAGDFFKVNGILGFDIEFIETEQTLQFTEDGGGEAENHTALSLDEITEIEWDGSLDHCHILMTDGQGYAFTSFHYNQRGIPEEGV